MNVAFLVAKEGIEQVELTEPWKAVEQAGHRPVLISPERGRVRGFHHLDKADEFDVDTTAAEASADDYAALVLPGGVANPDQLREDGASVALVRDFVEAGLPIAVICHGPWTLVEADVVQDRTLTSYPSLRTDLRNAGATVVDQQVCIDGNLITSRSPKDLDAFCQAITDRFASTPAHT
jgi:protease I